MTNKVTDKEVDKEVDKEAHVEAHDEVAREIATRNTVTESPGQAARQGSTHTTPDKDDPFTPALLYECADQIKTLADTPMSVVDFALHMHHYFISTDVTISRSFLLDFLCNSDSNLVMSHLSFKDRELVFKWVDELVRFAESFREDPECTEANIRAMSKKAVARTLLFDSPGIRSSHGPEDRDSATGAREAGSCFADSSSSTRESQSNGLRETQSRVGDNQAIQLTASEKRGATSDAHGDRMSKRQKKNQGKGRRRGYGSKIIPNTNPSLVHESSRDRSTRSYGRSCLRDAVLAHLHLQNCISIKAISSALEQVEPKHGDTSVDAAGSALRNHGWNLVQVSKEFFNGPRHHNLLQVKAESKRMLLIGLHLFAHSSRSVQCTNHASHFVAWDGSIIHDRPDSIRVNNSSDRTLRHSKEVFERLYPKSQFSRWKIVSVFELVELKTVQQSGTETTLI